MQVSYTSPRADAAGARCQLGARQSTGGGESESRASSRDGDRSDIASDCRPLQADPSVTSPWHHRYGDGVGDSGAGQDSRLPAERWPSGAVTSAARLRQEEH